MIPLVLKDVPAGPKKNPMTGVIERIEMLYTGKEVIEGYDFEDSFIDDSDFVCTFLTQT